MGGTWESAGAVAEARELNTWDLIKAKLAERIAPQEFQNWVMRTALESLDQGSLRVQVPDQVTKDFIEQEYTEQIRSTIRELNLPVQTVVYLPHAESRRQRLTRLPLRRRRLPRSRRLLRRQGK